MDPFEIAGFVTGVIGVALMIRQHLWAWPVGLVQVAIYAWVFYRARLYPGALLQVTFFVLLGYGWWSWWRGVRTGAATKAELPVTRLDRTARALALTGGVVLTLAIGAFMSHQTDAAVPYWDAFLFAFSLIAQALQTRKKIETWTLWVVVNAVAIGVYLSQSLWLTAALYAVFLGLAGVGWRVWHRHEKGGATP